MIEDKDYLLNIDVLLNDFSLDSLFFFVGSVVLSYCVSNNVINKKLEKDVKTFNIKDINIPNKDILEKELFYNKDVVKHKDVYERFINAMKTYYKDYLKEETYEIFARKLDTVNIKEISKNEMSKNGKFVAGFYRTDEHQIFIIEKCNEFPYNEISVIHELIHSASGVSYPSLSLSISGFSYKDKTNNAYYGTGLNEGFTELLTKKFVLVNNGGYLYFENVANILYKMIGNDMITYYFSNDITSLINDLSNLSSREETEIFIRRLDILLSFNKEFDITTYLLSNKYVKKNCSEIKKYLLKCYKEYIILNGNNHSIYHELEQDIMNLEFNSNLNIKLNTDKLKEKVNKILVKKFSN